MQNSVNSNPLALPSALESIEEIMGRAQGKKVAIFLDYDGTLTPIVATPEKAFLSGPMRDAVIELAKQCIVAVISGRDLQDVRIKTGIDHIYYAGSHGFDIAGPKGSLVAFQPGKDFVPLLDKVEKRMKEGLKKIHGALVERKRYSLAVHYRQVKEEEIQSVRELVDRVGREWPQLDKSEGKKVFEFQPGIGWNKGKALWWILDALRLSPGLVLPIYVGDDTTDENAFRVLRDRGVGIVVSEKPRLTEACYILKNPDQVLVFLRAILSWLERKAIKPNLPAEAV